MNSLFVGRVDLTHHVVLVARPMEHLDGGLDASDPTANWCSPVRVTTSMIQLPVLAAARGGACLLIVGIGKDFHNEGPQGTRPFIKHERHAVAILNVGGMNHNAQQEAERVDENMPLAAGDV